MYINFGHFRGLSYKNMTKRQRACGIHFVFASTGAPQDFIFSLTVVWDFLTTVKSKSLGAGAWNLRVSILLMVIVFNLYFMFKIMEREPG